MVATIGTAAAPGSFDAILQDFYLGPVQEQLNQEVHCLQLFEKMKVDWNGRRVIIPVHIARNTGVGYTAESGNLPVAGQQNYEDLAVRACFLYGRFEVTGPAMAAAKKGGSHAFINWADSEMKKLVEDVRDRANRVCVSGGAVKGYLNEKKASGAAVAAQVVGGLAADGTTLAWDYSGDFGPFAATAVGTEATWVRVELFRTDTFNPPNQAGGATPHVNPNIMVNGSDAAGGTLDIIYLTDVATGAEVFTTAGANLTDGHALALRLHATRAVDSGATPFGVDPATLDFGQECTGIYGNLSDPTHFTVTRNDADATAVPAVAAAGQAPILQCNVRTMAVGGAQARAAVTLQRLQQMLDEVEIASGKTPDTIMINQIQRQRYMNLLIGTIHVDGSKATQGDGGFSGYNFAGIPIMTSRHVDNGNWIFLKKDCWKVLELDKPGFADEDGNVLSRVAGVDSFEGFYKWYYAHTCLAPNRNIILTGCAL